MISEFQDLSDKIDRLAQMAQSLRSENYLLRQANALLSAENVDFKNRLTEAQQRVEALLSQLDPEPAAPDDASEADLDADVNADLDAGHDDKEAAQ
jgi:FtsZ-binding cell division protein ZapB